MALTKEAVLSGINVFMKGHFDKLGYKHLPAVEILTYEGNHHEIHYPIALSGGEKFTVKLIYKRVLEVTYKVERNDNLSSAFLSDCAKVANYISLYIEDAQIAHFMSLLKVD